MKWVVVAAAVGAVHWAAYERWRFLLAEKRANRERRERVERAKRAVEERAGPRMVWTITDQGSGIEYRTPLQDSGRLVIPAGLAVVMTEGEE